MPHVLSSRDRILTYQQYLLYAIAFMMPIQLQVVTWLLVCFVLLSGYAIWTRCSRHELTEVSVLFLFFFFLHVVGMIYTENTARGWFDLQVKLVMLVFPLSLIGLRDWSDAAYRTTLRMFLYGALVEALICLARSSYLVFVMDQPYYFFLTSRFSFMLHPSYFALYLIFALLILAFQEKKLFDSARKGRAVVNGLMIVVLSVSVLLTASKIGLVMWLVCMAYITTMLFRQFQRKWIPILGLMLLCSLFGILFQQLPMLQTRVMHVVSVVKGSEVSSTAAESTAARTLIYSSGWELVSRQSWYGQGTGDFQDALDRVYEERGFRYPLLRHFNAHNEFLQSWITIGIPGLINLLGIFMLMLYESFRSRNHLYAAFAIICLLISMTESVMNVQAGVFFVTIFAVLLSRKNHTQHGTASVFKSA